jgi:pimeloyl-ACP methyl ester carboxylesterase
MASFWLMVGSGCLRRDPGSAAFFVPDSPAHVLVLAHGYPWPDGSISDSGLYGYARAAVDRWTAFAEAQRLVLVVPVLGGESFPNYREMAPTRDGPDRFVNDLVDELASAHVPDFDGRFCLHGHSAGAQFAARFLVTHPHRLQRVVLSAPSTYPFPEPTVPWPNGSGDSIEAIAPLPHEWLAAASEVRTTVLVGSRDLERRPAAPGQRGSNRIERATAWVEAMHRYAETHQGSPSIALVIANGLDHGEEAMTRPAQAILSSS